MRTLIILSVLLISMVCVSAQTNNQKLASQIAVQKVSVQQVPAPQVEKLVHCDEIYPIDNPDYYRGQVGYSGCNREVCSMLNNDANFQGILKTLATLKRYQNHNQQEASVLQGMSSRTPEQDARLAQLKSYLNNQDKAIMRNEMAGKAIIDKYRLQDLKLHPVTTN